MLLAITKFLRVVRSFHYRFGQHSVSGYMGDPQMKTIIIDPSKLR